MMRRPQLVLLCAVLWLLAGSLAFAEDRQPPAPASDQGTSSEADHVAPDPPQHTMGDMRYRQMADMMQMDDRGRTGMVLFDQLEWRNSAAGNDFTWDAESWYGGDSDKIW